MKHKEINISSVSLDKNEKNVEVQKKAKKRIVLGKKIKELIAKFNAWWKTAPNYKKILVVAIPALILLGSSTFFLYYTIYGPRNKPPNLLNITTNYIMPNSKNEKFGNFKFFLLPQPELPKTEESPINGRLFTREEIERLKKRRPIATIISNHIEGRPTSNLSQADLVYEALVEGGITRFLAIHWSREPNKIGPIRSVRQYYLEWLSPFDPLLVYDGFATSSDPRVDAGGNISNYGIKSIYTAGAWRVNNRPAPHNEYSSTVKTWEIAKERGWDQFPTIEPWQFKSDAPLDKRRERFKAKVLISNSDIYNPVWEYDKSTNMYLRSIGGIKDIDMETNRQIAAKNVIIEEVKITGPVDTQNRLIITTIGSGNATILQDGNVIFGKWKKDSRTSRTKYYDNGDNEIRLNRGLTWILAVRQIQENFDIIEQ